MRLFFLAITGIATLIGETVVLGRVTTAEASILPRLVSILNENEVSVPRKLAMAAAFEGYELAAGRPNR